MGGRFGAMADALKLALPLIAAAIVRLSIERALFQPVDRLFATVRDARQQISLKASTAERCGANDAMELPFLSRLTNFFMPSMALHSSASFVDR
jgi:hypothetical protein